MRISSIKTIKNNSKYFLKTLFLKFMKASKALVSPNDITTNPMTITSSKGCFHNVTISDTKLMIDVRPIIKK